MSWSEVGKRVAQYAPMLGAVLGGPAGATIAAAVASKLGTDAEPSAVLEQLRKYPDNSVIKLQELENSRELGLQGLLNESARDELRAAVENAKDVNETMRVESASEHWATYGWRPAIGFAVALAILLSVLTVFLAYGAAVFTGNPEGLQHLPAILAAVAGIIGIASPILGIASWFRGKMQVQSGR